MLANFYLNFSSNVWGGLGSFLGTLEPMEEFIRKHCDFYGIVNELESILLIMIFPKWNISRANCFHGLCRESGAAALRILQIQNTRVLEIYSLFQDRRSFFYRKLPVAFRKCSSYLSKQRY